MTIAIYLQYHLYHQTVIQLISLLIYSFYLLYFSIIFILNVNPGISGSDVTTITLVLSAVEGQLIDEYVYLAFKNTFLFYILKINPYLSESLIINLLKYLQILHVFSVINE